MVPIGRKLAVQHILAHQGEIARFGAAEAGGARLVVDDGRPVPVGRLTGLFLGVDVVIAGVAWNGLGLGLRGRGYG